MKKIYLLAFSALLAGTSFAQTAKKKSFKTLNFWETPGVSAAKSKITSPNQVQAVIWSDDFSNPANWASTDLNATGQAWQIGTTGPNQTPTFLINSTSGGNFAMFDSDGAGQVDPNNVELVTVTPIDLTGHPNVNLVFEQHYMRYLDSTYVAVSTDAGVTWTEYQVNGQYATGGNAESADPEQVTVNISAAAGDSSAVLVKFIYRGFWDYWWLVDDVNIQDMPTTDGAVVGVTLPADGCLSGTAADIISASITNIGLDSLYNFEISYSVDGGTAVIDTVTDTILSGQTIVFSFTVPADLSAEADHTVTVTLLNPADGNAANDAFTSGFQNTVPVDLSAANYSNSFDNAPPAPDLFALYIAQNAGSTVNWAWATVTPHTGSHCLNLQAAAAIGDAWIMFKCMNVTMGDNYRLSYWTRTNTGYNGGISASIALTPGAAALNAGQVIKPFVATTPGNVWRTDSVDYMAPASGTIYLGIRGQGTATGNGTMVKFDDILIRKVAPVGIKETSSIDAISIFPNPNAGLFTVKTIENNTSMEVYSIIGENVFSSALVKGNNSVDLSNLSAGSYIVKLRSANNTTSKRIIINK